MKNQHPAIARAAALNARFWAHAPQPTAPVAEPEIETTPASQLEVETLCAEQEYLEFDAFLNDNPREYCADAAQHAADLYANWQCALAQTETQN